MIKPSFLALCTFCTPALADVPQVVADIAPVHGLAARVMEGVGTPDLIVSPGATPHSYALRPSNARALSGADVVLWVGPELTPGLEKSIQTLADGAVKIELLEAEGTQRLGWRETIAREDDHEDHAGEAHDDHADHADDHDNHEDHAEDHAEKDHDDHAEGHDDHDDHAKGEDGHGDHAEKDHDEHDGHDEDHADDHGHAHNHDGADPHAWLDPENGKVWLGVIAEALAAKDPENAALYRANAIEGQAEIDAANTEIAALLAPVADHNYVVFHDAYQYFEQRYGLHPTGAISLGDAADPSPARISELRENVRESAVSCVFSEPQFNAGLVTTVFEGTDARTAVIDPLGADIPTGPAFYPTLLRHLAQSMADCL